MKCTKAIRECASSVNLRVLTLFLDNLDFLQKHFVKLTEKIKFSENDEAAAGSDPNGCAHAQADAVAHQLGGLVPHR